MKERPILFSAPMVRTILSGQKTQTRRIVKPQPEPWANGWKLPNYCATPEQAFKDGAGICTCPYGKPGDRLWVRESFQPLFADGLEWRDTDYKTGLGYKVAYPATDGIQEFIDADTDEMSDRVRPSIHMPRWASRILLEIVSVRVERLQNITDDDCIAEGCHGDHPEALSDSPFGHFKWLWQSINGDESWCADPWVWVIKFRRVEA